MPIVIPSLGELMDTADIVDTVDGLIFTGSPSNIEPFHYNGPASEPGTHHDPLRDATTLPLMRAAIAAGVPVLGICRGFQEMNVALGAPCTRRSMRPVCSWITAKARTSLWTSSMARATQCISSQAA